MTFKAIMAMDKNGMVGDGLSLPWKNDPNTKWDMDNFKKRTTNHIVIMGYNTYKGFKKPLKNRLNLVIGRVNPDDKFYSLKDKKRIPNNPDVFIKYPPESEEYKYFSNIENAKLIKDKDELKGFLGIYWGLQEHITNENSNNENSDELRVNMTDASLDALYSYIPVNSTDERFVFINKDLFKIINVKDCAAFHEFDTLSRTYKMIRTIEEHNENVNSEEDVKNHEKILAFDPSEAYIIGGAKTYSNLIGFIDEFIITEFYNEYPGDIKFDKFLLDKYSKTEVLEEHENGRIVRYYN